MPVLTTAQKRDGERKVRIDITRNDNGTESHVTREFDLSDEKQLADALRELGVMDELNIIGDNENLVLDLRRSRDGGMLHDMSVALSMADGGNQELEAYMGVYYGNWNESCDKDERKKGPPIKEGACVTGVENDGPAEKAGLKGGDVIVAMDGKGIGSGSDLVEAIRDHKPGDKAKITYYRGREKKNVEVTLAGRRSESNTSWSWNNDYAREGDLLKLEGMSGNLQTWPRSMMVEGKGAFLGVDGDDVDDDKGVRITEVTDSSAAERMGLKKGDVIRSLNGKTVKNFDALAEMIDDLEPGSAVQLVALRGDKEVNFNGELGKAPRTVWSWGGDNAFEMPEYPEMPEMPEMPELPEMPEMPNFDRPEISPKDRAEYNSDMDEYRREMAERLRDMSEIARDREERRREMNELRSEMDRLRRDLRSETINEMRVTIDAVKLSPEETASLKNKGVVDLDNTLELPGLQVNPNPTDDSFSIAFEAPVRGDLSVDMHDAKGDRVYHESISGFKGKYERVLDWSDRADGTYFVVISQNGKAQARKLVKQ